MATKDEQKLLDNLEDARDELLRFRRGLGIRLFFLGLTVAACTTGVCVAQWGTSHHVDVTPTVVALCLPSITVAVGTLISLVTLFPERAEEHPSLKLRRAERAYRDYLMEQQ